MTYIVSSGALNSTPTDQPTKLYTTCSCGCAAVDKISTDAARRVVRLQLAELPVPPVRLATFGSRAFPVAAAHTWNFLPEHTVSASTLQSFKRHLKTFLLQQSFRLAL